MNINIVIKNSSIAAWFLLATFNVSAESTSPVNITENLSSVQVNHQGKAVTVQRNQDPSHRIIDQLTLTSRACPPHCLQPIKIKGVETVGELELLNYLDAINRGDDSIMVIDTRSEVMAATGTIPGSVNIHGDKLMPARGANAIEIEDILTQQFAVKGPAEAWNFRQAKTLVLYCYGIWCAQAPKTIDALIALGYPRYKLKWYRGGMQAWESVGLTTIRK